MKPWAKHEDVFLARKAEDDWSASRIGAELGRSRNSVIGRAHRLSIRLHGNRPGRAPKNKTTTPKNGNVVRLVIPRQVPASPSQPAPMMTVEVERPSLAVITNERKLIEDFIAKNGVRCFERTDRGDYDSVKRFLEDRGIVLSGWQGKHRIQSSRGRPRIVTWSQVIDLVDDLRASEGLPTIRRRA